MSAFDARLRLPGRTRVPLGVEVDISEEQLTLTTGERRLAEWSLKEIEIRYMSDGFHIKVDDEEVVLSVTESARFASELGVTAHPPAPRTKRTDTDHHQAVDSTENVRRRVSDMAAILANDAIAPQAAFAEWLGLLKELTARHARGALPNALFHELNGALLDMIPVPETAAETPA